MVIDAVENADHSVSAAQAPEGIDRRILQCMVDIIESRAVVAREIAQPPLGVLTDGRIPAE